MADDKTLRNGPDRNRVAAGEDYEVRHFARQAGITAEEARQLIGRHGNDRETLISAAKTLREGGKG